MIRALVALCLLAACLAAPNRARLLSRYNGRIVGGSSADIADYPWQLSLQAAGEHSCGASIISSTRALSAAHCVTMLSASLLSIRAGSSTRGSGGTVLSVLSKNQHPDFSFLTGESDVSVLQVSGVFPLGPNVQIVSLPSDGYDPPEGLAVTVTGWGDTKSDLGVPIDLMKVDISIIDRSTCATIFADTFPVTESMVCAGQAGQSVCQGDSGGPLVSGSTQVGIVSWGDPACVNAGAVYANVGNLRSWIRSNSGV